MTATYNYSGVVHSAVHGYAVDSYNPGKCTITSGHFAFGAMLS